MRTALIAGATGLVGGHLLQQLLAAEDWDHVVSVGRREAGVRHPKLEQIVTPLPAVPALPPVDDAFCALGTTIKQAGSQEAFRVVDHHAVVALANAAHGAGASTFLHVTALGASSRSRVFYNRVKGDTERDVAAVGIPTTVAFRPSMLDGDREESRPAERAGLTVMRTLAPVLGRYRPTGAEDVARAMVLGALDRAPGTRVVESREITRMAGQGSRS